MAAVAAAAALLGAEVGKYRLVTLATRSPSTHVPVNGLFFTKYENLRNIALLFLSQFVPQCIGDAIQWKI